MNKALRDFIAILFLIGTLGFGLSACLEDLMAFTHEAGHALSAKSLGFTNVTIDLSKGFGVARTNVPEIVNAPVWKRTIISYSGGLYSFLLAGIHYIFIFKIKFRKKYFMSLFIEGVLISLLYFMLGEGFTGLLEGTNTKFYVLYAKEIVIIRGIPFLLISIISQGIVRKDRIFQILDLIPPKNTKQ